MLWVINIHSISVKRVAVSSIASMCLLGAFTYLVPFPTWYMNPLAVLFFIIPSCVIFAIHSMTGEYICLLRRNQTEKERQSREKYATQNKLEDNMFQERIGLFKSIKNI